MAEKSKTTQATSRRAKKTTVKKAEVKPTPTPTPEPEPSNRNSTRAVADIPAEEGFLGSYSSLGRQKDDPQR